jgi:hypothetical protein
MKKVILFSSLVLLLTAVSCKKTVTEPIDLKHDYFQFVAGAFVEYDVMYIFHDEALLKHDTVNYQIKTQIGDTVIDNAGRVARKFKRYIREDSTETWILKDVWIANLVENRAELTEENQRKVKLVFAPSEFKTWDMNQFNLEGEMTASFDSIDVARSYGNLTFNKTLIVKEQKYSTLIDQINKYEIYARGVGMIYKADIDLKYNFGEIIPNKGTEYYYQITSYGIE